MRLRLYEARHKAAHNRRQAMTSFVTALGLAAALTMAPAGAKTPKTKTLTGCVTAHGSQFDLSTVTAKKHKHHRYTLEGSQNFASEVGHRVKVTGLVEKGTVKVDRIETTTTSCR
jgi:hypothetical protein